MRKGVQRNVGMCGGTTNLGVAYMNKISVTPWISVVCGVNLRDCLYMRNLCAALHIYLAQGPPEYSRGTQQYNKKKPQHKRAQQTKNVRDASRRDQGMRDVDVGELGVVEQFSVALVEI